MKALLVSPYLDVFGGAEKYLLDIGLALQQTGYTVYLASTNKEIKQQLVSRFGPEYDFIQIVDDFVKAGFWQRLQLTRNYQVIFYHPDGSYFYSLAKKNFILLQVPDPNLIPKKKHILARSKFFIWQPVYNSLFTKRFFDKLIPRKKGVVLYPTITVPKNLPRKKSRVILSVGRFFKHLHSKRQDILIQAFIKACQKNPEFSQYRLILAGGCKKEDQPYLKNLQRTCKQQKNILFKVNLPYKEVEKLYQMARFYWHAAGYKINEQKHPEAVEHFGISIIQAMSFGAIPLAYKAGGPKETIFDQKTGYLYRSQKELIEQTQKLIKNPALSKQMEQNTYNRVKEKFGFATFQKKVQTLLVKI